MDLQEAGPEMTDPFDPFRPQGDSQPASPRRGVAIAATLSALALGVSVLALHAKEPDAAVQPQTAVPTASSFVNPDGRSNSRPAT